MKKRNIVKELITFFLIVSVILGCILGDAVIIGTGYIYVSADESDFDYSDGENISGIKIDGINEEKDDEIEVEVVTEEEKSEPCRVILYIEEEYDYNHETYIPWEGAGYGTIDDPYLISTAEDLIRLRDNVNAGCSYYGRYFKLTNNIDLYESYPDKSDINWVPIGYYDENDKAESYRFDGCFDGDGYTIRDVDISSDHNSQGLFGFVTGEIKNLTVTGYISSKNELDYKYAGGIVGVLLKEETVYNQRIESGSITNCSYRGTVSAGQYTGGIVGFLNGDIKNCVVMEGSEITGCGKTGGIAGYLRGNVIDCTNYADVTNKGEIKLDETFTEVDRSDYCGGIVGYSEKGVIEGCLNVGKVDNETMNYTGGITGAFVGVHSDYYKFKSNGVEPGMIKNCTNKGYVSGEKYTAGIAGYICWCNVSNCVNNGDLNKNNSKSRGGIVGSAYMVPYIEYCTNNGKIYGNRYIGGIVGYQDGKYPGSGWLNSVNGIITQCINNGEIHGDAYCFGGIAGRCDVGNDITFCTNTADIMYFGDTPKLGKDYIGGIVGKFDNGYLGNACKIFSCINSGNIDIGWAMRVGGIAGHSEVRIIDCTNMGNITAYDCAGGICGRAKDTSIENCYNAGNVKADDRMKTWGDQLGGIVGYGNHIYNISRCRNAGDITGTFFIGGIAGFLLNQIGGGGSISDCINNGDIVSDGYADYWDTDTDQAYAGGIAGAIWGMSIDRCTNKGDVEASGTCVGGLTGQLYVASSVKDNVATNEVSLTVNDSYNIGDIEGKNNVGGLIGYISYYTSHLKMMHCYNYGSIDSDGGDWGKLVGDAKSHDSDYVDNVFTDDNWNPMGWDSLNVYSGYHYLKNKNMTDFSKFTDYGFSNDIWEMGANSPKLKMERSDWAKNNPGVGGLGGLGGKGGYGCVLLHINNLDDLKTFRDSVNNGATYDGLTVVLENDIDLTDGKWEPIGHKNYLHPEAEDNHPFLGYFQGNGHSITGLNVDTGNDAAGLFGWLGYSAGIYNLYVSGTVKGTGDFVGGLAGLNGGSIVSCFFEGDVTGTSKYSNVGGIAGSSGHDNSSIINCGHVGTVISGCNFVGGIIGHIDGRASVRNSFHYGDSSTVRTNNGEGTGGGIVGHNIGQHRNVYNCFCMSGMDIIGRNGPAPRDNRTLNSLEDFKDPTKTANWTLDFDVSSEPGSAWGFGPLYPCLQSLSDPVKLVANNGTGEVKTYYVHRNSNMSIPDCTFTNGGYKFAGWNSEPDGTGISYDNNSIIHGGEILYAQWEEDMFTINYNLTYTYKKYPYRWETAYTISSDETLPMYRMKGYRLIGWQLIGKNLSDDSWEYKIYSPGMPLKGHYGNFWFDAIWEEDPTATPDTCTVQFVVNGIYGDVVEYDYGTPVSEIVVPETPDRVIEGFTWTFDKWDPEIGDVTDDVIYWSRYKYKKVNITYDSNGGIGYMEPTEGYYDKSRWTSRNGFTRRGYTFTGWNTERDGSGDSYFEIDEVHLTEDITLYAQWSSHAIYMLDLEDATYTGSPICPDVTVKDGDEVLVFDTDYMVDYTDNVSSGAAKVLVTGKGDYADRVATGSFIIFSIDSITPEAPQAESKTDTSITLMATEGYQYKCNDGEWQDSNVFTGLEPDTEYVFYQRNMGDINHKVSDISAAAVISTEAEVIPEIIPEPDDKTDETPETPVVVPEPDDKTDETPETPVVVPEPEDKTDETPETPVVIPEPEDKTDETPEAPEIVSEPEDKTDETPETPEVVPEPEDKTDETPEAVPENPAHDSVPSGNVGDTTIITTDLSNPGTTEKTDIETSPVITKNDDGTVTEVVSKENPDGSKILIAEIKDTEGELLSKTITTEKINNKGTKTVTAVTDLADNTRIEKTETVYKSGASSIKELTTNPDNSTYYYGESVKKDGVVSKTVKTTDAGKASTYVNEVHNPDGGVKTTEKTKDSEGNTTYKKTVINADGSGTVKESKTWITGIKYESHTTINVDGSSITSEKYKLPEKEKITASIEKDVNGKTINRLVKISVKAVLGWFTGNKDLTEVVIGKNVTKIDKMAFYNAKNLKTVTIYSDKITDIGTWAFYGINKKAVFKIRAKGKKYERIVDLIKKSGVGTKVRFEKIK